MSATTKPVPDCFLNLLKHARGMTRGVDWNKGTQAGYHREPLVEAVVQCQMWLAANSLPLQQGDDQTGHANEREGFEALLHRTYPNDALGTIEAAIQGWDEVAQRYPEPFNSFWVAFKAGASWQRRVAQCPAAGDGREEPFTFVTVLGGRVQRQGSKHHCQEWADAWNSDASEGSGRAEVWPMYRRPVGRLKPVLAMILQALDRDARDGREVRGEMAQELRAAIEEAGL